MADVVDPLKGSRFVKKEDGLGWWSGKSGIRLRYADRINPTKLEESLKKESGPDDQFALLSELLRVATGLELKYAAEDPWRQRIVEILQTPDSVPLLRSLYIRWSKEDVEYSGLSESLVESSAAAIASILDCIKSRNLSHLNEIWWHVDGLDRSGADKLHTRALADIISADCLPSLTEFRLQVDRLEDESLTALGRAFADGHLKQLTDFSLRIRSAGEHDVSPLAAAFEEGAVPVLQELLVYDSGIGDAGAEALARAFAGGRLKTLIELYLWNNSIGDRGIISLAESFKAGGLPDLTTLHVDENPFGTEGAIALSRAYGSGQLGAGAMTSLWARSTRVGEDGARALVDALSNNPLLVVDMRLDWESYPRALKRRNDRLLKRNLKSFETLSALRESMVPATMAKVYLCGNPEVGKTTLRRSFQRSFSESMFISETRSNKEERTKGIDVSEVMVKRNKQEEQNLTLMIWDMAGQDEYHLLHNSVFPDLSFMEGNATTFIIMCSSKSEDNVQQLEYWLQFIASSCGQNAQNARVVWFVVNRMDGDTDVLNDENDWKSMLEDKKKKFKGYLNIQLDPFIVDVRKRRSIQNLKETLVKHSKVMLKTYEVPEICQFIQANLGTWSKEMGQFPVVRWIEFVKKVGTARPQWPEKTIEAAASYLNEAGTLIYIAKDFLADQSTIGEKLVVLNSNWFCKEVVGHMLLPHHMAKSGQRLFRLQVDQSNGSIPISRFMQYFTGKLSAGQNSAQVEDFLRILLWLGLCYKGHDQSNIFIPSLIEEDQSWRDFPIQEESSVVNEDQWVMGFTIEHLCSDITLASLALWHKFQVKLAQSHQFNGGQDNDYAAGKFFITFQSDFMRVLIQVNAAKDHPTFDRIDIFVKPALSNDILHSSDRRICQVDLADSIAETLLQLWEDVCPGVACVQRVVWPWPASNSKPSFEMMSKRNIEVMEVKRLIQEDGLDKPFQWTVGSSGIVTADQLLSTKDKKGMIQSATKSVQSATDFVKTSMRQAVELGMCSRDILNEEVLTDTVTMRSKGGEHQHSDPESITANVSERTVSSPVVEDQEIHKKLNRILHITETTMKVSEEILRVTRENLKASIAARDNLKNLLIAQKNLVQKVHGIGKMFLQDKEASFPKFCYLGKQDSTAWTRLKDALSPHVSGRIRLYFACEAKYDDSRPHIVTAQPGIDLSVMKDWAQKLAPWLNVALTLLFVSAKAAANFAAPGTGFLFPDAPWQQASSLSEGIALLTGYSQEELSKFMREGAHLDEISSQEAPKELYAKSRRVVNEILSRLSAQEFEEKLKLTKMTLTDRNGNFQSISWVCLQCHEKYKR